MKLLKKITPLLFSFAFLIFSSCQDEVIEETPPNQQEVIQPNSTLANLMRHASANDGSIDNIMDNSDCFTVNLPVTIIANGITITIETLDDLSLIEAIFDASNTDDDELEFLFPITIILNDYTEVNIETLDELEDFIETCVSDEEIIECADFVYPISFSIYNTDFQIIDTVIIDNDYELYIFLESLDDDDNDIVLASLNFPVTIAYANGTTVEVNNNQALEEAINAANENCEDDCDLEDVIENLQECYWVIAAHNVNNNYLGYHLYFNENNLLQIIFGTGPVTVGGEWHTSIVNGNVIVTISELTDFTELEGDWMVVDCDDDRYELTQEQGGQTIEMVLEQDCSTAPNPFECFEDVEEINANIILTVCDSTDNIPNNGVGMFDLTTVYANCANPNLLNVSYHISETNAQANVNAIANPEAYLNASVPAEMIYVRVELLNNPNEFDIFTIDLFVENCNPSGCTETDVDTYLQNCVWYVVNFNGDDHLIMYELDFISNTEVVITGNGLTATVSYSTSQSANGVIVEFMNVALPDIQAINGEWLVVECQENRLELEALNSNNTMVMEQDCNNAGMCTVGDVEGMLLDCEWTVTSYAGSDFSMFNIDFNANSEAVIYMPNGTEEYTANWSVSQGNNAVEVVISNVSGGNVQIINGTYTVVECTSEQLILHDVTNSENELVLDRDCG